MKLLITEFSSDLTYLLHFGTNHSPQHKSQIQLMYVLYVKKLRFKIYKGNIKLQLCILLFTCWKGEVKRNFVK
jgi:hypothetical protein